MGCPPGMYPHMEENTRAVDDFLEIPLSEIGERYLRLRLIRPKAEAAMADSLKKYGQLVPVVVSRPEGERYELIDGFKRLRACRKLGLKNLRARIFDGTHRASKAAIIHLNWKARSLVDLEEAMIVHSLYREDKLTQVEIATLLGRHKSWVSRRISLIERLSDEVQGDIRLGLVSVSIGRELARLPRGNQAGALSCITKHSLTYRETVELISMLLESPRWDQEKILRLPLDILEKRQAPRPGECEASGPTVHERLLTLLALLEGIRSEVLIAEEDRQQILSVMDKVDETLNHLRGMV